MTEEQGPLDLAFLLREDLSDSDFAIPAEAPAPVVNWRTLEGADAESAWNSLREWVEWFTVRYQISESTVPVCWFMHDGLVEELSALHALHTMAFDPSDSGLGPLGWHERLSLAMPRLRKEYYNQCSRGHDSYKPRSWPSADEDEGWGEWISQSHAG